MRFIHPLVIMMLFMACAKPPNLSDVEQLQSDLDAHPLVEKLCQEQCFNLVSFAPTKLCVGIPNSDSIAEQLPCESVKGQRFYITKNEGTWTIHTLDGRCLGVAESSKNNGALVEAQSCSQAPNQQVLLWSERDGDSRTKIRFRHSDKCLDVLDARTESGIKIIQRDCVSDVVSQQYYLSDVTWLPDLSDKIALDIMIDMKTNTRPQINVQKFAQAMSAFKAKPTITGGDIYFVFANGVRWDYLRRFAPTVSKFIDDNMGGRGISSSTDSDHSIASIMLSQPSHFATQENGPGAYWLQLLRRQGYKIVGIGPGITCSGDAAVNMANTSMLRLFGKDRSLLSNCNDGVDYSSEFRAITGYKDGAVINRVIDVAKSNRSDSLYVINLSAARMDFTWDRKVDPFHPHMTSQTFYNDYPAISVRGYEDAVESIDLEFARLLKFLKSTGRYDRSTVVFVSDHGTLLGEKPLGALYADSTPIGINGRVMGNGKSLHTEINEIPIAIKAPKVTMDKLGSKIRGAKGSLFSQLDIVPTILDGIGIDNFDGSVLFGNSLFSSQRPRTSALVAKAEFFSASPYMMLINKTYKVLIKIEYNSADELMSQTQFKVIDITDLNDQSVYNKGVFAQFGIEGHGKIKDVDGFTNYIKTNFADALKTLFVF